MELETAALNRNSQAIPVQKPPFNIVETKQFPAEIFASQFLLNCTDSKADNNIKIQLFDNKKKLLGAAEIELGEISLFQSLVKLPKSALEQSIFIRSIWLNPQINGAEILPVLLYFTLRKGRILGRQNVVTLVPNLQHQVSKLLKLELLPHVKHQNNHQAAAQRMEYSILHVFDLINNEWRMAFTDYFMDEILETHAQWLEQFFQSSWCQAMYKGLITKEQYIWSLYNLHQYVRQTTRLAARCIAHAEDMDLRNHFIYHLKGEINHELLIEKDLMKLGGDVDYLKTKHLPHYATKEFMVVQESTIGFYQDTLMMIACPLAAEGFGAHLQNKADFLDALYHNIESWGIKPAKDAAVFLTSHIKTDGGDDGHWIHLVNLLRKFMHDEYTLQRFLSVYHAAKNGFARGFNKITDDMELWSATAQHQEKKTKH